jgi:hypothetical protein
LRLFGKKSVIIRSTQDAEGLRNAFDEDYALFLKVQTSEELKRYKELKKYVNSATFKDNRKKIEQLHYKGSSYYETEVRFKSLIADKKLKAYYIIKDSEELQGYMKLKNSELYKEFLKLKLIVNTSGFDRKLRMEEWLRYKEIRKDDKIIAALRFERNKKFKYFQEIEKTDLPAEFEKLNAYIKTSEFTQNRDFLVDKNRFKTTDDYKLLLEYEELADRSNIKKYFALQADKNFLDMMNWDLVFEDDFKTPNLDRTKWITKYYAGERLLNDTYAVGDDIQLFIDENVSVADDKVKLVFKKEDLTGKYWDKSLGFKEKEFKYTSGTLNNALSMQGTYGRIEAKIKVAKSAVKQSFWMKGAEDLPQIAIMESTNDGLAMGVYHKRENKPFADLEQMKEVRLSNDYYIFTLEWTKHSIIWKINDTKVKEMTRDVPDIPMYLGFSLGATHKPVSWYVPSEMEIDWVRCYKKKHN